VLDENCKPGQWTVICRESSPAAAKVMKWLDGAFDAMERGFLASFRLSIIVNKEVQSNALEAYTFSFDYSDGKAASGRELIGVTLSGSGMTSPQMMNARASLITMSRCLRGLVQSLSPLPAKRFLTAHLRYTDDCPESYNPPGYQAGEEEDLMMPNNELWKATEEDFASIDSGYHRVGLRAAYLSAIDVSGGPSSIDIQIPEDLEYTEALPIVAKAKPVDQRVDSQELVSTRMLRSMLSSRAVPQNAVSTQDISLATGPSTEGMVLRKRHRESKLLSPLNGNLVV